jgi:hypothetical protein
MTTPTLWTTVRAFGAIVLVCAIGAIALYALVAPARAESLPESRYGDVREVEPAWIACQPDARRYCSGVWPGGGRILSCLAGNRDRLSYECRESLLRAWENHWRR